MKVLYISKPFFADCDFPLIKAFQQKGVDVTVLYLLAPYSLTSTLFDIKKQIKKTTILPATAYSELKCFEGYLDMSKVYVSNRTVSTKFSWSYLKETYLLRKFISKGKYDIVHFVDLFNLRRGMLYKMPNVFLTTIHDPIPHSDENNRSKRDLYRKKILQLYKGIILLNEKQKDEFCSTYNVNQSSVHINRLGVYECLPLFVPKSVKKNPYNVLFFGNIRPYKGLEYLCEAMKKVCQIIPQATLTIAGRGDLYFDIEPYLNDSVHFYNRFISMSELAYFLKECSICVCPYTDATQSGVIMTAFSLAVPVIATDVGGIGEMIEVGKNGELVPSRDASTLANAIIDLLNNQEKLLEYSYNIQSEYFNGEKSWSQIAGKYIDYYQSFCSR